MKDRFLTVRHPERCTADGLYECFGRAFSFVGVDDWKTKLIGFGCDGANVNIAPGGLRGHLEEAVPWVTVFWCFAHHLELAIKDALNGTIFTKIDEMLLRVYYLYEIAPTKRHELDEVVTALRSCLEPDDLPEMGGNKPLRACGTRWVSHKVGAIGRLVDRYGAYIAHLIALIENPSVKSTDKQKLKGYLKLWSDARMILGCALFHDILYPIATLCKSLQTDELCIVTAIEAILRATKIIEKVKIATFESLQ